MNLHEPPSSTVSALRTHVAYDYAIRMFVEWYCDEPRLGFNRSIVARYRTFLEQEQYAASTINLRLGAVRRLASEAADSGPLSPDLAAGIRRVKGVKSLGSPIGNWLTTEQARQLLTTIDVSTLKGKRDYALVSVLLGCGLRRAELIAIRLSDFDQRDGHWLLADLRGKGGHIRTVPVPQWVKSAVDRWTRAAGVTEGAVFRAIDRAGKVRGDGIDTKVIWTVVRCRSKACGLEHIAPHDLRRTCARLCHEAGGELEQIQFLLGHVSIQTTERYLGCKQKLRDAVNDRLPYRDIGLGVRRLEAQPPGGSRGQFT